MIEIEQKMVVVRSSDQCFIQVPWFHNSYIIIKLFFSSSQNTTFSLASVWIYHMVLLLSLSVGALDQNKVFKDEYRVEYKTFLVFRNDHEYQHILCQQNL